MENIPAAHVYFKCPQSSATLPIERYSDATAPEGPPARRACAPAPATPARAAGVSTADCAANLRKPQRHARARATKRDVGLRPPICNRPLCHGQRRSPRPRCREPCCLSTSSAMASWRHRRPPHAMPRARPSAPARMLARHPVCLTTQSPVDGRAQNPSVWPVAPGPLLWPGALGPRPVALGPRAVHHGLWPMALGPQPAPWPAAAAGGTWPMPRGSWPLACGPVDHGPWQRRAVHGPRPMRAVRGPWATRTMAHGLHGQHCRHGPRLVGPLSRNSAILPRSPPIHPAHPTPHCARRAPRSSSWALALIARGASGRRADPWGGHRNVWRSSCCGAAAADGTADERPCGSQLRAHTCIHLRFHNSSADQ